MNWVCKDDFLDIHVVLCEWLSNLSIGSPSPSPSPSDPSILSSQCSSVQKS